MKNTAELQANSSGSMMELMYWDYKRFLAEYGFSHEAVRAVVDDWSDHAEMPEESTQFVIKDSPIEGKGVFAARDLAAGSLIGPVRIGMGRTLLGRLTNHSPFPNAMFERVDNSGGLVLRAKKPIVEGAEVLIDYRQAGSVNGVGIAQQWPEVLETAWQYLARKGAMRGVCGDLERFLHECALHLGFVPGDAAAFYISNLRHTNDSSLYQI